MGKQRWWWHLIKNRLKAVLVKWRKKKKLHLHPYSNKLYYEAKNETHHKKDTFMKVVMSARVDGNKDSDVNCFVQIMSFANMTVQLFIII